MQKKSELRKWAKELRKKYNDCGDKLVQQLTLRKEFQCANNVMIFYPTKDEINLLSLLTYKNKKFYLPRVEGEKLLVCPYKAGDKLVLSDMNIMEPKTSAVNKNILDMVIVPALCCDKNKCRLGYGGGFYDRFLQNFHGLKIVCIPSQLVVDTIYPEVHDIPVDIIITI